MNWIWISNNNDYNYSNMQDEEMLLWKKKKIEMEKSTSHTAYKIQIFIEYHWTDISD